MNILSFSSPAKKTNNANNATHYVKLGKKRRESSKRKYYIISLSLIITAIIINLKILPDGDPNRGSALVVSCSSHSATENNKCLISSETKLELQEPPARSRGFEPLGTKHPDFITILDPCRRGVHAAREYQGSTRSKCSLGTSRCYGHFQFQARKDAVRWASGARRRTTIMMDANHGDLVQPVGRRSQCCRNANETRSWDFLAGSQLCVLGSSIASTGTCGSWCPVARTRNTTRPKVQQRQTGTDRETWIVVTIHRGERFDMELNTSLWRNWVGQQTSQNTQKYILRRATQVLFSRFVFWHRKKDLSGVTD